MNVTIVGAGNMGRGIGHRYSNSSKKRRLDKEKQYHALHPSG